MVLPSRTVTVTELNLTCDQVRNAWYSVGNGHVDAVENLYLPLGWTYNGNANADVLLTTSTGHDGTILNFTGADTFNLNGGNDNVWMGDGNDTGSGGAGNDTILGGLGNDKIDGGAGKDALFGDEGADRLTGGTGADTLTGGAGADRFIFVKGDGADTITDFAVRADKIDLAPGTAHSLAADIGGTLLHYGSGTDTVLLLGVDLAHAALITFI